MLRHLRELRRTARITAGTVAACLAVACSPPSGESRGKITVDPERGELRLRATFHRGNAERGTWHLLVHEAGDMASLAYFTTDVTPKAFYDKLIAIGAQPEDTVTCDDMGAPAASTRGAALSFSFEWEGVSAPVELGALLLEEIPPRSTERKPRGLEIRFGGNHEGEDADAPPSHASGCLSCLYTCCAGVTSNPHANLALLKAEDGWHRYRLNPAVDIADLTRVTVIVRRLAREQ